MPSRSYTESILLGVYTDENINARYNRTVNFTVNETLANMDHLRTRLPHDVGGPFHAYGHRGTIIPSSSVSVRDQSFGIYRGRFASPVPALGTLTSIDMNELGAAAYARLKPTRPSFDAATAIGELKDVPRMIRGLRDNFRDLMGLYGHTREWKRFRPNAVASRSGSEFLGVVFGWLPLYRSCVDLVEATKKASGRVDYLIRNNGKPVRTRCILASGESDVINLGSESTYAALTPALGTAAYVSIPTRSFTRSVVDRRWGSARMRYWLPTPMPGWDYRSQITRALYGNYVNLNTVYQLMPWSWLIDWYTNTGDMIQNLDAGIADRLAADYCYVMRTNEVLTTVTANGRFYSNRVGSNTLSVSAVSTSRRFDKRRHHGDPFGFSTKSDTLSSMQVAILGALGLSRLR